jgi:hypothetical protein
LLPANTLSESKWLLQAQTLSACSFIRLQQVLYPLAASGCCKLKLYPTNTAQQSRGKEVFVLQQAKK